jgi:hypothetical protein
MYFCVKRIIKYFSLLNVVFVVKCIRIYLLMVLILGLDVVEICSL